MADRPDYQQRVVDEKDELDAKIKRLWEFVAGEIYAALESDERIRLRRQGYAMQQYSGILGERIAAFVK